MIDVDINIETNVRSMTKLLSDLKMGLIQIPPFQRQFVWHNDDVKSLLDSIKKNYPIGSVLLWRPLEKPDWNGDLRETCRPSPPTPSKKSPRADSTSRLPAPNAAAADAS